MVKAVAFFKRKAGMPVDEFQAYWLTRHPDVRAMHALRGTPAMAAVVADEARFIDRSTMGLIITEEHVSKEGPTRPGAAKSVGFVRRRPGMAVEVFQRHWREIHWPARRGRAPAAALRTEPHAPGRLRGGARAHLGRRRQPLVRRRGGASRRFRLGRVGARGRNPNFIAEGPVQSIVTTEHVIVA
jgi:hypothetical protein